MTDYASSVTTAKPSWTWWMTTAAAAAIRMRNLRDHHGDDGGHRDYNDVDDEFAESDRKRQRCCSKEEFWMIGAETHDPNKNGSQGHDSITVGPLDLSVKATVTTAADVINGRMMNNSGSRDEHVAKTPVKRSTITNSRSSKKSTGKMTGSSVTTVATVKAATRKLLPQLLLDHHVDRSSPVSGTIIVPAKPDQGQSTCRLMSSSSPYITATDCVDSDRPDDDYDGGDIDPEFNVVVATDEARRRLESIPNALGPYRCRLCSVRYVDAFALARHRCRCIVHVRYRCPECDKVFQCPANLASHRRWHGTGTKSSSGGINNTNNINNGRNKGTTENVGNEQEQQITTNNNDDDDNKNNGDREVDSGETTATTPATSTAAVTMNVTGFKKNILQRAVQAAAAAAIATHENIGVTKNVS